MNIEHTLNAALSIFNAKPNFAQFAQPTRNHFRLTLRRLHWNIRREYNLIVFCVELPFIRAEIYEKSVWFFLVMSINKHPSYIDWIKYFYFKIQWCGCASSALSLFSSSFSISANFFLFLPSTFLFRKFSKYKRLWKLEFSIFGKRFQFATRPQVISNIIKQKPFEAVEVVHKRWTIKSR